MTDMDREYFNQVCKLTEENSRLTIENEKLVKQIKLLEDAVVIYKLSYKSKTEDDEWIMSGGS